jgi:hypothetical protein
MEQDTEKTKVIFRQFTDGTGEIIALFPELPGNRDLDTCMSYMRVGQHATASVRLVEDTILAHPSNYATLKAELEDLGYNLQVCYRFTYAAQEKRRAALKAMEAPNG